MALTRKMAAHVGSKLSAYGRDGCHSIAQCPALELDTGCHVSSIHQVPELGFEIGAIEHLGLPTTIEHLVLPPALPLTC